MTSVQIKTFPENSPRNFPKKFPKNFPKNLPEVLPEHYWLRGPLVVTEQWMNFLCLEIKQGKTVSWDKVRKDIESV